MWDKTLRERHDAATSAHRRMKRFRRAQKAWAPDWTIGSANALSNESEIARNRREGRRKAGADHGDRADNDHRDKGRNEAVFDRRGAALVLDEACKCRHLNCSGKNFQPRHCRSNARTWR